VIEVRDETVSHLESAKRKPFPELRYAVLKSSKEKSSKANLQDEAAAKARSGWR
jgi:hypothetical protein